jgi:hypothetical protein
LISGIDAFIERLGGVGPLLSGILSMITLSLSHKITPAVNQLAMTFSSFTTKGVNA